MPKQIRVQHWTGWDGGKTYATLTIDDKGYGVIDNSAKTAFSQGQCHALAVAINRPTGWPIKGVGHPGPDTPDSPAHCLVWCPELKKYVDINGTDKKIAYNWKVLNRNVSKKQANSFRYYLKPNVKAALPFAKTIVEKVRQEIKTVV